MAERSMAVVLKTTVPGRVPGVRIPLPPPDSTYGSVAALIAGLSQGPVSRVTFIDFGCAETLNLDRPFHATEADIGRSRSTSTPRDGGAIPPRTPHADPNRAQHRRRGRLPCCP